MIALNPPDYRFWHLADSQDIPTTATPDEVARLSGYFPGESTRGKHPGGCFTQGRWLLPEPAEP